MHIPEFFLPSQSARLINFRQPDVDTALRFTGRHISEEEKVTTEYLNHLQDKAGFYDSKYWTAQDRRTALWWIFIHSRPLPMYSVPYECDHCGELHHNDINLRDMDEYVSILEAEHAYIDNVEITVQGEPYTWRILPLDGQAMERLELLRSDLPEDEDSEEYREKILDLRFWEFIFQCHNFYDIEPDFDKAAFARYELVKKMDIETEFMLLAYHVKKMQEELAHGLPVEFDKGKSLILFPPHYCTKDAGKEPAQRRYTRVLAPFRCYQFIPDFGRGWLADLSTQPDCVWGPARRIRSEDAFLARARNGQSSD